jgi:hypothetical protein
MAFAQKVYIRDPDGTIKVGHIFYGETVEEAQEYFDHHLQACEYFKSAYDDGRVIEEEPEEGERPDPDDFEDEEEEPRK